MKRLICLAGLVFALGVPQFQSIAQTPTDINEGSRLEFDGANQVFRFKWWARSGRTYFIQHSDNLLNPWQWVPAVESGNDSIKEWAFATTGDKFFVRLKYSDAATSNPGGDDFDGDGISNLAEVQQGMNPFNVDSDGDGMSDGWELTHGLNPVMNDASLDSDGDGLSNLTEYLTGTDPSDSGEVGTSFITTELRVFTPLE